MYYIKISLNAEVALKVSEEFENKCNAKKAAGKAAFIC